MAANDYEQLKSRLCASAMRRGQSSRWIERQARLKHLFKRIDTLDSGYISQGEVENYAKSLRMPASFVHDFIAEGDSSGSGRMNFEEFAAYVRAKEITLRSAFDSLEPNDEGVITGKQLKEGLRGLELRSGRYNTRKKLRRKSLSGVLQFVDDESRLTSDDFRDLLVLMPADSFVTVQPYYMKVGLDIGPRRLAIPDRRKEGSPWGHFIAGGIAGIVAKTATSPLNVVAIRTTVGSDGTGLGLVPMVQKIFREEGPKGLFKGNLTNALSSAPGKAIDFFAYSAYKKLLTRNEARDPTNIERLLAGSLAGMTSDTLLYPLEVISSRLSISTSAYSNSFAAAAAIVKQVGIKGLYSGWGSAMLGTIPYTGLSFATYDILSTAYKRATNEESAGVLPTLACGVASGFIASTASYPIYRVTLRLQTGLAPVGMNGTPLSVARCLHMTAKEGGARALFRGWVPSSLKIVPQAGFSFVVYELVRGVLQDARTREMDENSGGEDASDGDDNKRGGA
jgi:solute carrier family 25 phosphate transporter 23/24/25/41